jgi:AcrR family transcriptional regulator
MPATKQLRWERRPDERPQELLDAALTVFAERGYRNATLDDVADAAGVTKGTIYHYFSTKEALLLRAIEHYQDRAFARLQAVRRGDYRSAADRVRAFVTQGFGSDDPARRKVHALLQGIGTEAPAVRREWLRAGPVRGWRLLTKLIDDGKSSGEFRPDVDAEVAISEKRLLDAATDQLLHSLT